MVLSLIKSARRAALAKAMSKTVRKEKLTYLSETKFKTLIDAIRRVESANIPGRFIEAGCALGGSSIVISTAKQRSRKFEIYDVFGMIPPPSSNDGDDVKERYRNIEQGNSKGIDGDQYYGYIDNLYDVVVNNLTRHEIDLTQCNISLVKGLLQDTLTSTEQVSFAHIDVDWYDPVLCSLQRIVPYLSVGGFIILDDYHDWTSCKNATNDFFLGRSSCFEFDGTKESYVVRRVRAD